MVENHSMSAPPNHNSFPPQETNIGLFLLTIVYVQGGGMKMKNVNVLAFVAGDGGGGDHRRAYDSPRGGSGLERHRRERKA